MPGGVSFIHATYGDKEIKIAVTVGPQTVATINAFTAAVDMLLTRAGTENNAF